MLFCVPSSAPCKAFTRRLELPRACSTAVALACCLAASASAADAPNVVRSIQVPPGFEVELVAGPPLVQHPTMAGFDDQGRLYVADGPGMNMPAKQLLEELPNLIRVLEDADGDGRFDKSTVFADKMTFPMGSLWHAGTLYVASPPSIWKIRDTDGDGVADLREELVSEFGFTGNAADIHGCFLGPDGRIYWCDGRHGHNFVDENGNELSKGLAARIFSCRADGSDVEAFAGGGMDNPVEVAFTDEGEILGTVAIFDNVEGRHDALVHWIYGGVYPHHRCVAEFKRTGDLLPALSRFGQVAPAGCMQYQSSQFGDEYRGNVFLAQFNTHNVVRTRIERDGATFRSQDENFLTSDNPDFHPTDVLEDADGSLLVIDTGGWFRIGCPTSRIAKPEILGGIYRIRRKGAAVPADPRGLKLEWANAKASELAPRLADKRPAVAERAITELASRGDAAVEPLLAFAGKQTPSKARTRALWTLARIDTPAARDALRQSFTDQDASVRLTAVCAAGRVRDQAALDKLTELVVSDESAAVRREAATALGRLHRAEAAPALLAALRAGGDRFLEHALIYALIQIDDRAATLAGLEDANPQVRRAALIALDQMNSGGLTRELVAPLLDTNDVALQQAALEVIQKHEGWAAEITGLLGGWLAQDKLSPQQATMVRGALLAFCKEPATQTLVAKTLANEKTSVALRLLLLEVVARSELPELPAAWLDQLGRHLDSKQADVRRQAVTAIAALGLENFDERLLALARDEAQPLELRVAALAIASKHGRPLDGDLFAFLQRRLDEDVPPIDRLAAAEALGASALDGEQLGALTDQLAAAGPLELPALVGAYERDSHPELGLQFVAALSRSPGVDNLPPGRLDKLLGNYPADVQRAAEPLKKRLNQGIEEQRERLRGLAAQLAPGTPAQGRAVFYSKKASCSACHRIRGEGGNVGPDLSKIGQIRQRLDFLESILYPSASLARGFESYTIVTEAGLTHTGILSRETADAVYLRNAQREEVRVPRSEIDELGPSRLSIMPQGLDRQITPDELRDLVSFLESLK